MSEEKQEVRDRRSDEELIQAWEGNAQRIDELDDQIEELEARKKVLDRYMGDLSDEWRKRHGCDCGLIQIGCEHHCQRCDATPADDVPGHGITHKLCRSCAEAAVRSGELPSF